MPVAEVAHEQVAAEVAEACWGLCQPPGRVEVALAGQSRLQNTVVAELGHEAARSRVGAGVGVNLGVGNEDIAADVLDVERAEALGNGGVGESVLVDLLEIRIEDVNRALAPVGRVKQGARRHSYR